MVSSKSLFSAAFAGIALCAVASAQTTRLDFQRVDGPLGKVHYDVTTGKVTKVVRPGHASAKGTFANAPLAGGVQKTSVPSFNNTITTGYFTSGNLGAEFVDWATKASGLKITTAIRFGYATTVDDPSIQGPGASLDLSFYSGTTGFCVLGNETDRFTFTGLPGRTASIPVGSGAGYLITAFLGSQGICVPDGRIGWGYCMLDSDGSGGSLTGPLLTDFTTNTGWNDAFDFWAKCPANTGSCVGTFFFGGCVSPVPPPPTGTPCGSFILGLNEWTPTVTASCTARNGGTNPAVFVVTSPTVIGGNFSVAIPGLGGLAITAGPIPGFNLNGSVMGRLLCDPSVIFGGIQVVIGSLSVPIPKDVTLEGLGVCAQAALKVGSKFQLTNAQDCTFGG